MLKMYLLRILKEVMSVEIKKVIHHVKLHPSKLKLLFLIIQDKLVMDIVLFLIVILLILQLNLLKLNLKLIEELVKFLKNFLNLLRLEMLVLVKWYQANLCLVKFLVNIHLLEDLQLEI